MNVTVRCLGGAAEVLGSVDVAVFCKKGVGVPYHQAVVPIDKDGFLTRVLLYLPDLDMSIECPMKHSGRQVEKGDTATIQFDLGIAFRIHDSSTLPVATGHRH